MKEFIGTCSSCSKDILCLDGFFNGVQTDDKKLYCYDCYESEKREKPQS